MSETIRVLLVDDHAVVRAGLRAMLAGEGFEIVGEASNGVEAVERAVALDADVVVMDVQMPELDGVGATRRLKMARPSIAIVILTTFETEADIVRALDAGAIGYLLKDAPAAEIAAAVRAAWAGKTTLSSQAAAHLVARTRGDSTALSRRELDVLEQVARGASNGEAAKALRISEATVKTHLLHVFEKLGVNDRTAAVTVAIDRKILRL